MTRNLYKISKARNNINLGDVGLLKTFTFNSKTSKLYVGAFIIQYSNFGKESCNFTFTLPSEAFYFKLHICLKNKNGAINQYTK